MRSKVERLVSFLVRFWIHPVQKLPGAGSRNSLWPEEKREVQRSTGEECVERPDYTSLYGTIQVTPRKIRIIVSVFVFYYKSWTNKNLSVRANKFLNSSDVSQFYRFYRFRTRKKFSTSFTIQEYREKLGPSVNHHNSGLPQKINFEIPWLFLFK